MRDDLRAAPRSHPRRASRWRWPRSSTGRARGAKLLVVPGEPPIGTLGDADLDRVVARDALAELEAARSGVRHYGPQGQTTPEDLEDSPIVRVFVESYAPPPQMWIFGAVDFTAALAKVAKVLGYRVTVSTPARCSPPAGASRWPTRWSCRGRRRCSTSAGKRSVPATPCAS